MMIQLILRYYAVIFVIGIYHYHMIKESISNFIEINYYNYLLLLLLHLIGFQNFGPRVKIDEWHIVIRV